MESREFRRGSTSSSLDPRLSPLNSPEKKNVRTRPIRPNAENFSPTRILSKKTNFLKSPYFHLPLFAVFYMNAGTFDADVHACRGNPQMRRRHAVPLGGILSTPLAQATDRSSLPSAQRRTAANDFLGFFLLCFIGMHVVRANPAAPVDRSFLKVALECRTRSRGLLRIAAGFE